MNMSRCSSCRALIVWLKTGTNRRMPVDADTVKADDVTFDHTRHISHFATCPDRDQHRKPRT